MGSPQFLSDESKGNVSSNKPDFDSYVVVLTGGIASGKTAVSDQFTSKGIAVVDGDVIARMLVEPGRPALDRIRGIFGNGIIDKNDCLDRSRVREMIFADTRMRAELESILHPAIRQEAMAQLQSAKTPYVIYVVPLLAESGSPYQGDRVLLVDVPEEIQIARVIARDDVSRKQAEAILDAQASRSQRMALADDVVVNDGDLESLHSAVEDLHFKYLEFAAEKTG